ncbi:MAG: ABC transporter permease [Nitriliruptorales bacterium]
MDRLTSGLRSVDLIRLGFAGIRRRRGRSVLTTLGIAIGIAAIVAVVGISASSRAQLLATLDRLGTNYLRVTPGQTLIGEDATLPETAAAMIGRIGEVEAVASTASVEATVRRTDLVQPSRTGGISVLAAETDLLATLNAQLKAGRFLDDAIDGYPVVVLGATAAERLGLDVSHVADLVQVWLGERWFTVVGILEPVPLAPELDRAALVGWDSASSYLDFDRLPTTVYVRTDPAAIDRVRALVPSAGDPEHPEEVTVSRPSDALAARATAASAFTTLLLALGAVALLVGGLGTANVMVIAVLERRTEIGLRRALGATRRHVGLQFLVEAVLQAALGGLAGILLGAVITAVYASSRGWLATIPLAGLAVGVGAALTLGAIAGLYPALKAARLAPAEAVRPA